MRGIDLKIDDIWGLDLSMTGRATLFCPTFLVAALECRARKACARPAADQFQRSNSAVSVRGMAHFLRDLFENVGWNIFFSAIDNFADSVSTLESMLKQVKFL